MRRRNIRKPKAPKLASFNGFNRILEDDANGYERVRTEQVVKGNCVYHPTKGWRRKSEGFNPKGHMKILKLISRSA